MVKAWASCGCRRMLPTKMAKARPRVIELAAIRMAIENENTMPTLAKVRSTPEATPKERPGAAFMTAALLAGKKAPAPMPLMIAARTTIQSGVVRPRLA